MDVHKCARSNQPIYIICMGIYAFVQIEFIFLPLTYSLFDQHK
jgi:hypothetical protein